MRDLGCLKKTAGPELMRNGQACSEYRTKVRKTNRPGKASFSDEKNKKRNNITLLDGFFKVRLDFLRKECYIILKTYNN